MDVYRIGTLLEMVREMAYALAEDGKLVKVCVQQSMGQGVFQVCVCLCCITLASCLHHASPHDEESEKVLTAQHGTARHGTTQHSTAQHGAAQP